MPATKTQPTLATSIAFPAIAMLLGWGLRGYIGGGPFAAMIPGAFVALSFSLMFGHDVRTAAALAMFGALGIGYGGDMTYGQTLGYATKPDTMYWGLLGTVVKGGVWGLLGGAVMGAGLTRHLYNRKTLSIAFLLTVIAFYLGWKLVNEPKLIYFSDPVNKPRDESWAGLLFAAASFLAYLRAKTSEPGASLPLRFALWGALGGALGFGGGTLWMVFGPHLPLPEKWFGWWKMMEFSFGLIFGAALGLCAWLNREQCAAADVGDTPNQTSWWPTFGAIAFVALMFVWAVPVTERAAPEGSNAVLVYVQQDIGRIVGSYIFFGAVCFAIGLRSVGAAWQIGITLTFFHTVLDLLRSFTGEKPSTGFSLPSWAFVVMLFALTAWMGIAVAYYGSRQNAVLAIYLLLMWTCYAVATVKTVVRMDVLFRDDGQGIISFFMRDHPAAITMHLIFTVSAVVTTAFILRLRARVDANS